MAKGYWVNFYRSVSDDTALANYAAVAAPAIQARGGRFLAPALRILKDAAERDIRILEGL